MITDSRNYIPYTAYYVGGPADLRKEQVSSNAPERVISEPYYVRTYADTLDSLVKVRRHLYKRVYERVSTRGHHDSAILIYVYDRSVVR